jgi:Pentapeptide repeats (8 copies)
VSPIRGLLTKAAKGTRHPVFIRPINPWLLPAGAIIIVALADIGFGKVGAFLALAALAVALVGFSVGLVSSASGRHHVEPTAGSPLPTGNAHGATTGVGAADITNAVADAGSNTHVNEAAAVYGGGDDATAGTRTDLSFARMTRARLLGADLRGADLRCAVLRGADLRGANLNGVNLEGADLTGAKLAPLTNEHEVSE